MAADRLLSKEELKRQAEAHKMELKPKTVPRHIRVEEALWESFLEECRIQGIKSRKAVSEALTLWLEKKRSEK